VSFVGHLQLSVKKLQLFASLIFLNLRRHC